MLSKNSKVFFVVFFFIILSSIALTYYNIYILKNYNTFTESDDIPAPTDVYIDLFNLLRGKNT